MIFTFASSAWLSASTVWHHAVVRRDDEHDDIGRLCTACAHLAERFVAGRIENTMSPWPGTATL
jgi:hypothetical protein